MTNIQLTTKELLPALQTVINVVEKKHNIPILSHVLINISEGILTLTTTDSEIQIQHRSKIASKENCQFTLYAKSLIDIIKNQQQNTTIDFEISKRQVKINISNNYFELNALNHQDFPLLSHEDETQNSIEVGASTLKFMLDKTSSTIANQDIRVYLNGLYIKATKDNLTLVSTDGYRLAIGTIKQFNKTIEEASTIIPKKTVLEILKLLAQTDKKSKITLKLSHNYLKIQFKETEIISQLINSKYPNYEQVIPDKNKEPTKINRLQFNEALKSVLPFVDENNKSVQLNFDKTELTINVKSERGSAKTIIKTKSNLEKLTINFNIHYLIGVLDKLITENACIILPDENNDSYLFMNETNEENYQYIIMPIKV